MEMRFKDFDDYKYNGTRRTSSKYVKNLCVNLGSYCKGIYVLYNQAHYLNILQEQFAQDFF